jgi:UDP:flavonoid glycosyltransferase YjiC (YdhE family)
MHLTIASIGSRGDVQPFITLGLALQQTGHTVQLVTHANFETDIKARGLEFALISGNPQESTRNRAAKLGATFKPIPRSKLTAENLASAMTTAINDEGMRQRAKVLGEKIEAENGVAQAVKILHSATLR